MRLYCVFREINRKEVLFYIAKTISLYKRKADWLKSILLEEDKKEIFSFLQSLSKKKKKKLF